MPIIDAEFVRRAGYAGRLLDPAVHDALVDFVDDPGRSGAIVFHGLPIGEIPPTPPHPTAPTGKDLTSEFTLLTVARRLGQPVGYLPELGGEVVQNLVPTRDGEVRQVSTSSRVTLDFHTETAFHPHRPRYLVLLCLRGDPAAVTTLCSVQDALEALDDDTIAPLWEPRFRCGIDESFLTDRSGEVEPRPPAPVLWGTRHDPRWTFDADLMTGTDPEADASLAALRRAVKERATGVVLDAGDLLVVDNTVAVHGRTPFVPRYDGTDRWLQRTFVVADLAPSLGERSGRVITTAF
jgi:hypothetical protein